MNNYYKYLFTPCLCVFFITVTFCSSKQSGKETSNGTTATDSLWFKFAKSMESKNIEYLIENSLDTIQCADCNLDGNLDNEYYESHFVFEKHLDKLMHLSSLSNRNHSIYQDDSLMHVIYDIKSLNTLEGGYNLIFNFIKVDEKYLFEGMIVTP